MKKENRTKKLEFKKETIARLGEGYLNGVYGGTGLNKGTGGEISIALAGQCTVVGKTEGANHTCNAVLCKTKPPDKL
jgi:hypothetical protein